MQKSNAFIRINGYGLAKKDHQESDDYFDARIYDDLVIAVVADGVGSAQEGRSAAIRTVESLLKNFKIRPNSWSIKESLAHFISSINRILYLESIETYDFTELVTTLAVIVIEDNKLYGANVGDSRIYVRHDDELRKLSKDHNLNQKDMTHVLTKAIGLADEVEPYIFETDLFKNDKVLLCSDGLYNELDEQTLLKGVELGAKYLVEKAKEGQVDKKLPDDTSAVLIDVLGLNHRPVSEDVHKLIVPEQLRSGDVIDGYTLTSSLIQNMRTWKVEKEGVSYVMKFAPLEVKEDKRAHDLFVNEAWNANRLKAGFFPKAFIPPNRTHRYYIMEYLDGHTLLRQIKKRPLSVDQSIDLAKFLLKAVQFLSQHNLLHGDIKPENIIVLERDGKMVFKLIDFGSIVENFSIDSKAGTPSYLAPERFNGEAICEQSELYAIGVTLYQALTLKYPYGEIEPFQKPSFTKKVKAPQELNKNIPLWLNHLILRALAKDQTIRYRYYSEFLYDLEHPEAVKPFYTKDTPWIERDPLSFYKFGFWLFLILDAILLFR